MPDCNISTEAEKRKIDRVWDFYPSWENGDLAFCEKPRIQQGAIKGKTWWSPLASTRARVWGKYIYVHTWANTWQLTQISKIEEIEICNDRLRNLSKETENLKTKQNWELLHQN